jgi:tRNA(adenine34) deaminase
MKTVRNRVRVMAVEEKAAALPITLSGSELMAAALEEARLAAARGEVPVGAVISQKGVIIARAGNRTFESNDPTAHAEVVAIRIACQTLQSPRLTDCDLHVTLEPCAMCAGAISHARLRRLYYGASDAKGGAVESGPRFFAQPTCTHAPEIYPGINESEAASLLRKFFQARR